MANVLIKKVSVPTGIEKKCLRNDTYTKKKDAQETALELERDVQETTHIPRKRYPRSGGTEKKVQKNRPTHR